MATNPNRTRRLATGLLVAMLLLLVISARLQAAYPVLAWVRAFAEAAAVGALADWFAVTALFRHPLGLKLPHTAIIARRKNAIGASLGEFIERHFLTPKNVVDRVARVDIAAYAAEWLREPGHAAEVAGRLHGLLVGAIERLDGPSTGRAVAAFVADEAGRVDHAGVAAELLAAVSADRRHQDLLDQGLRWVDEWLMANRDRIQDKLSQGSRYTPRFVDEYLANRFVAAALDLLHEVAADPDHALRQRLDRQIDNWGGQLRADEAVRQTVHGQALKAIGRLHREGVLDRVWPAISSRLAQDADNESSAMQRGLEATLVRLADRLLADPATREPLNAWAMEALEAAVRTHRHEVARLIADVVARWDADEVSARIEAQIGDDLQYIRINGTLVGGLVGLVLHALPI